MAVQITITEVRKTMEAQLERLRKLELDMQSAKPPEQNDLNSQINTIAQDIRNLDTMLRGLIEHRERPQGPEGPVTIA
jgi:uncharacterized protein YoxC